MNKFSTIPEFLGPAADATDAVQTAHRRAFVEVIHRAKLYGLRRRRNGAGDPARPSLPVIDSGTAGIDGAIFYNVLTMTTFIIASAAYWCPGSGGIFTPESEASRPGLLNQLALAAIVADTLRGK